MPPIPEFEVAEATEGYFDYFGRALKMKPGKNPFLKTVKDVERQIHLRHQVLVEQRVRHKLNNGLLNESMRNIRRVLSGRRNLKL